MESVHKYKHIDSNLACYYMNGWTIHKKDEPPVNVMLLHCYYINQQKLIHFYNFTFKILLQ